MKIRNKQTGQTFEVLAGTLYAKNIFEEVTDDEIKVGEPTVKFEIEEVKETEHYIGPATEEQMKAIKEFESKKKEEKKKPAKKKTTKKGAKKNGNTK